MRPVLTFLAILFAGVGPIVAQARVVQSPAGRGLALVETGAGHWIEDPGGAATSVEIPQGTLVSAFHELADGWIVVGHRWADGGNEIVLLRSKGDQIERVEPPARVPDALRTAPVPLIDNGRLAGLAWLEGDGGEKNAVMASRWTGSSWEVAETVSPMTGEAQLALSATVLDDGSSLLVWAAVSGADDEIFWSRPEGGHWRAPARVHPDNDVPDVSPKVVTVAGDALIAWSQYDGKDYRLRVARFADGSWIDTGFVGEEGSLFPTPFPTPGGIGFLYQTATPRSWSLLEIGAEGVTRRRAAMSRRAGETRPLVFVDESETVYLRSVSASAAEATTSDQASWHRLDWTRQP